MAKTVVLTKPTIEGRLSNDELSLFAQVIDTQYDLIISEALRVNDLERVAAIQWGRLFLTQKYGF